MQAQYAWRYVMRKKSPVRLHSVGVVITAEFHNPSILNPGFLVSEKIVPTEWIIKEAITTKTLARIKYSNGIQWTVDQQRLEITEKCDLLLQEHNSSQIHDLARLYVEKLPHVPYRGLGLNCIVSIIHEEPRRWLTQQFLKASSLSEKLYMAPRFTMDMEEAILNLNFGYERMSHDKSSPANSVIIDCNLHHDGPFDPASLRDKIDRWTDRQKKIASVLDDILEGQ